MPYPLRLVIGLLLCMLVVSGCRVRDYNRRSDAPAASAKPVPVTIAPAKPVTLAAPKWYVPRASWAVQKIHIERTTPMGVKPFRITVHHSADIQLPDGTRETGDAVALLRFVEDSHVKGIGKNEPFACIGYHFIIAADGKVYEGRPLQYQGAHSTGDNNIGNIGICLLGDFDKHEVPAVQKQRLAEVLNRLCTSYAITPSRTTVLCHKDFKATACPGRYLEPIVRDFSSGRMTIK